MQSLRRIALTRRGLMADAALGAASLALPARAVAKMPDAGLPHASRSLFFPIQPSAARRCTVSLGQSLPLRQSSRRLLQPSTKEEIFARRVARTTSYPADKWVLEQNILIANLGDRPKLFDTGMGSTDDLFGTSPGKLMSTLRGAGIDPANTSMLS